MKSLILLLVVALATGLPRQTKKFPKKFDSSIHGNKSSYATYDNAPATDLTVPGVDSTLDGLQAPSSYNAYFERLPEDPLRAPEGPAYSFIPDSTVGEALAPPAVDTYSDSVGTPYGELVPPPPGAVIPADDESYVKYEGDGTVAFAPPPLSTYADLPSDEDGEDVLSSLASMARLLPPQYTSTYEHYHPETSDSLSTDLVPPRVEDEQAEPTSSYAVVPEQQQPEIEEEQGSFPAPSRVLLPPSQV